MLIYPYNDFPEHACREIENKNRIIKNSNFGLEEPVVREKFFNCSFVDCRFFTDKIISSVYINCHFQNCIFSSSNKINEGEPYPFPNTIYSSCSFSKCCFNKHKAAYETMNCCIFKKTTFKNTELCGYHLVDVHFKNCTIRDLSFDHSVIPLILIKDCNTDELNLSNTKIGCLNFHGGSQKNIIWENAEILNLEMCDTEGDFNNDTAKHSISIPDFSFRTSDNKW